MPFFFGKKDKNPPEVTAQVAKAQPNPPKIQNPPAPVPGGTFPTVKPPQPTGLMPAASLPAGTATTQPMPMPRASTTGLKASRPGQVTRSTQRIVIPSAASTRISASKPMSMGGGPTGRINLPIGMILRCLPPEVLAEELSKFEANGKAATEIGLPMSMILGQLPSGKVEMTLQDLLPHFPAGYLQPTESISGYLGHVVSLPLMDVVMRIPPDLLALRPDQKDVDASVINMADPFTEEILREQAEARRAAQANNSATPNIIDESQAPQEEFVPRDQLPPTPSLLRPELTSSKPVALPRRNMAEPTMPGRPMPQAGFGSTPPPMPPVSRLPTPMSVPPPISQRPVSLPSAITAQSGPLAPTVPIPPSSGLLPLARPSAMPPRPQVAMPGQIDVPSSLQSAPPMPPVPRQTGPIPAPPPPRHTSGLPVPFRSGPVPDVTSALPPAPTGNLALTSSRALPEVEPATEPPSSQDSPAESDNLARLAALAMAQMGESDGEDASPTEDASPEATAPEAPAENEETAPEPLEAPEEETPAPEFRPTPMPSFAAPSRPEAPPMPKAPAPFPPVSAKPPLPPPPVAVAAPSPAASPVEEPSQGEAPVSASVAFNLNTCSADDLVKNIPDCHPDLAASIVEYRGKIGSFKRLEDLLDVPGITKAAYKNLTGEEPPSGRILLSLNELLGYPGDQEITLKDVTDRIACWPDVTGCVLSQSSGLSLVGTVPPGVDKAAVVAFAPRMFDALNKSFSEVSGQDTDALVLPTSPTSFHLFRNKDLYLIITCRLPQMPERHLKVARFVLSALSIRKD